MARTWIEISRSAFTSNIGTIQEISRSMILGLVVKSNAYGHGLRPMTVLAQEANLPWLCTGDDEEALLVREYGWQKNILILSTPHEYVADIIEKNIAVALYDLDDAVRLQAIASRRGKPLSVHLKIDTGLGRFGIAARHIFSFVDYLHKKCPLLSIEGMFTQLANTFKPDHEYSHEQLKIFREIHQRLAQKISLLYVHAFASGGLTLSPELRTHMTMIRIGAHAYGLWKSDEQKTSLQRHTPDFSLKPLLTWKTRIVHIKHLPAESFIGYNRTIYLTHPTKIGIIPVGYSDGYPRNIEHGVVMIGDKLCPALGNACMNVMMIDISHVPSLLLDQDVVLLGSDPAISAGALAKKSQTINLEILTRINPLLQRSIVE